MKLPFRSGIKQHAKPKDKEKSAVNPTGQMSLRSRMLQLMAAGAILILLPPIFVYLQTVRELDAAAQKQAELTANLFANDFTRWIDDQSETAELSVKDSRLARIMEGGSEAERAEQAEALAYLFPASIRVRLLPAGIEVVDMETSPPISYAALDMLRHAETQDTQPPVEVHMFGTPQQHINLVRRILDPSGRHIVGHLMVSFPVQRLQDILDRNKIDGYAEVQQLAGGVAVTLGGRGPAALKDAAANSEVAIPGLSLIHI